MFDLSTFIEQVLQSSLLEWLAVLTSVAYVILAARNHIACWPFALVTSSLYIYICFDFQLYIESGLQLFYFAMAIIGWALWSKSDQIGGVINRMPMSWHLITIISSTIGTVILGFLFSRYTDQASPYVDAFTTCFSLSATFLVTKRVIENWLYWIIIDTVSIYLYANRGLYLSSLLFLLFTVLAIVGYLSWTKKLKTQINA